MNWKTTTEQRAETVSDPRIDSPQIKVVYPSGEPSVKKDAELNAEPAPVAPVKPIADPIVAQPKSEVTSVPVAEQTTPAGPPAENWKEVMRKNATLFIVVALISALAGLIIGKKI